VEVPCSLHSRPHPHLVVHAVLCCRDVPAATAAAAGAPSSEPLVSLADIEHALLAGLGERKRAKTLKKLGKNLRQMQGVAEQLEADTGTSTAAAAESGSSDTGAGSGEGSSAADAAAVAGSTAAGQTSSRLDQLLSQQRRPDEQGHLWHGKEVVAAALARGGEEELQQLVQRFRKVFVVACNPKYLPANWAVDAVDSREFGEHSVFAREEAAAAAAAGAAAGAAAVAGAVAGAQGHREGDAFVDGTQAAAAAAAAAGAHGITLQDEAAVAAAVAMPGVDCGGMSIFSHT